MTIHTGWNEPKWIVAQTHPNMPWPYKSKHLGKDMTISLSTLFRHRISESWKLPKESGDKKENRLGGCFTGFRYRTEMPKFMNGIVKSTTCSRSYVIVKSPMAKSARCSNSSRTIPSHSLQNTIKNYNGAQDNINVKSWCFTNPVSLFRLPYLPSGTKRNV